MACPSRRTSLFRIRMQGQSWSFVSTNADLHEGKNVVSRLFTIRPAGSTKDMKLDNFADSLLNTAFSVKSRRVRDDDRSMRNLQFHYCSWARNCVDGESCTQRLRQDWEAAGKAWWKHVEYLASDELQGPQCRVTGLRKGGELCRQTVCGSGFEARRANLDTFNRWRLSKRLSIPSNRACF